MDSLEVPGVPLFYPLVSQESRSRSRRGGRGDAKATRGRGTFGGRLLEVKSWTKSFGKLLSFFFFWGGGGIFSRYMFFV